MKPKSEPLRYFKLFIMVIIIHFANTYFGDHPAFPYAVGLVVISLVVKFIHDYKKAKKNNSSSE